MVSTQMIAALPGGEACLLMNENEGILVDSGYDVGSDDLVQIVKEKLGGRPLASILVTHSHYDHICGCVAVKDQFPEAVVTASALTAELLCKQSVRDTMRRLNNVVADQYHRPFPDRIDRIRVDETPGDGTTFSVCGLRITALETPGHTRCCMSYYIHEEDLLVCSESLGAWAGERLVPAFIVSYPLAMQSIERCAAIHPGRVIVPHLGELPAEDTAGIFARARQVAEQAADFVLQRHRRGMEAPAIVQEYIEAYYASGSPMTKQAMQLNTDAMVTRLIQSA